MKHMACLDCTQFCSEEHLAGNPTICKTKFRPPEDRVHLDMAENVMRCGMSSVYSSRSFKANNKSLHDFDKSVKSSFRFVERYYVSVGTCGGH